MNGLSSQFVWTNRSKESLALDIKTDRGQETLEALRNARVSTRSPWSPVSRD
jgi:crotonobetainyl-CoA:carnitine CoA-transferase CaiB-like acyl-CoA transferase